MSASQRTRLAVIFGGASVEHAVSVRSARAVIHAAESDAYEVVPIGVTRDGVWMRPTETEALLLAIEGGAPGEVVGGEGHGVRARTQEHDAGRRLGGGHLPCVCLELGQ